jgi:hypothetical protein
MSAICANQLSFAVASELSLQILFSQQHTMIAEGKVVFSKTCKWYIDLSTPRTPCRFIVAQFQPSAPAAWHPGAKMQVREPQRLL